MKPTVERLKSKFDQALVAAFGQDLAGTNSMIFPATNPRFGDYQCNVAMSLAKKLRINQGRSLLKLLTISISMTVVTHRKLPDRALSILALEKNISKVAYKQ